MNVLEAAATYVYSKQQVCVGGAGDVGERSYWSHADAACVLSREFSSSHTSLQFSSHNMKCSLTFSAAPSLTKAAKMRGFACVSRAGAAMMQAPVLMCGVHTFVLSRRRISNSKRDTLERMGLACFRTTARGAPGCAAPLWPPSHTHHQPAGACCHAPRTKERHCSLCSKCLTIK